MDVEVTYSDMLTNGIGIVGFKVTPFMSTGILDRLCVVAVDMASGILDKDEYIRQRDQVGLMS